MDLALLSYNGWCAIKPNQTKPPVHAGYLRLSKDKFVQYFDGWTFKTSKHCK